MNKKELLEILNSFIDRINSGYTDLEDCHIQADNLLLDYINDAEITDTFHKINKWYA